MAATNYTPIQLYYSSTASAAPTSGNLANGELAINITDGKLYYKDNGGVVQVLATKGAGTIGGSTTQIQYNNAGALAGSASMTFNSGTNVTTLTTLNLTNALGAIYGGTAQSAYAQGDVLYASATNTLSKLGIGTVNYILTSTGSVPQWSAPSSIIVQTATNLAGGAGGSVPYQSAVDTTTFLAIGAANRVMTSSGTAPQWVTSLTGLTGVSSSSITNTSLTSGRVVYSGASGVETDSASLTFNGTTLSAGGFSTTGLSTLVQTVKIGDSNFSGTAVFAAATPAKLYIGTGTVTDTTSAIGATNAVGAISSLAITPIAATNTSVTYTNAATLYIAGAPSAGTNVTLTNPYSLYVAAGDAYFGGTVTAGTVNLTTLDLTNLEVTNIKAKDGTAAMTIADSTGVVSFTANPVLSGGTANGVLYLNGSKSATSGSALTFDGTNTATTGTVTVTKDGVGVRAASAATNFSHITLGNDIGGGVTYLESGKGGTGSYVPLAFFTNGSEQMRLNGTGLGLGVTPTYKLDTNITVTGAKLFRFGNSSISKYMYGYIDAGGTGITNSDPYTSGVMYYQNGSAHNWFTGSIQSMTLDTGGRLLVAATTSLSSTFLLQVGGAFQSVSTNLISVTDTSTVYRGTPDGTGYEHAQVYSGRDATTSTYGSYLAFYTENKNSGTSNTSTEKVRITSAGNTGFGTNVPVGRIDVVGDYARFKENASGAEVYLRGYYASVGAAIQVVNSFPLLFLTSNTEAARFDTSQNLLVGDTVNATGSTSRFYVLGTTSVVASTFKSVRADYECSVLWSNTTTGNNVFATFATEAALTTRGSISYNRAGGLTVYNTTSDYRAKDIFGAIADSGSVIDSVPVYMGKMHGATQERPMFLAHETPEYAHTGEKDAVNKDGKPVYQQMDASALIPVMWAELQSLRARLKAANI